MSLLVPDARAHEGHLVWGDPGSGSIIYRGFSFRFPDLANSDDRVREDMETDLRRMAANLQLDEKVQVAFTTSSNHPELKATGSGRSSFRFRPRPKSTFAKSCTNVFLLGSKPKP